MSADVDKLEGTQLRAALSTLPSWTVEQGSLVREFRFANFSAAIVFVNRVAELAEAPNHHPDIDIRYNRVRLALTTHDANAITTRDTAMAAKIDDAFTLS